MLFGPLAKGEEIMFNQPNGKAASNTGEFHLRNKGVFLKRKVTLTECWPCANNAGHLRTQPCSSPYCKLSLTNHAPRLGSFTSSSFILQKAPWCTLPPFRSLAQMSADLNRTAHTALISVPIACLIFFHSIHNLAH